ncbi:MAG: LVIVD repeat-containing protein [Gemmatimonadales bacterium]
MRVDVKQLLPVTFAALAACGASTASSGGMNPTPASGMSMAAPTPDPRVGLRAGLHDAGEASWNLNVLAQMSPPPKFVGATNSDLAFFDHYAIQGNYNGWIIWDISNPRTPTVRTSYFCPASQNDVSVYHNLLFMSSEANSGRLDCEAGGISAPVSTERMRGIRIFDISDLDHPKYVSNVQTCRGSHTHSVLVDPKDPDNVYVYISGQAGVRSSSELAGCSNALPENDPNSAHFRIEVIKVPLAHPEQAAIVSSPRIFNDLAAPPTHGAAPDDQAQVADARAHGEYVVRIGSDQMVAPSQFIKPMLDSIVKARGGSGEPTAADSATLRGAIQGIVDKLVGAQGPARGPDQCHDITLYPAIGYAGGACAGYGMLLDIHDPANPVRLAAVSDSNFSYWHSATFSNDGTKLLFSDEWGGGGAPKCRATDPKQWGADAIFAVQNNRLVFQSYYKMPAPQTSLENCVAHNGSLIPIPGRDVMVQAWYQGGISVFDWTDAAHPHEIAFFDRGPVDSTHMAMGGSWSVYWYNGVMVSSEIARGLDVFELKPSAWISQNEIDAAKTVHLDYLNVQGQPEFVWPASFALARAYLDQLERDHGLGSARISTTRNALLSAERLDGPGRREALSQLATQLDRDADGANDRPKMTMLSRAVKDLAAKQ